MVVHSLDVIGDDDVDSARDEDQPATAVRWIFIVFCQAPCSVM